jgi:hypothetical protein
MLIVREVFTAKPGQAGKFARLFKRVHANMPNTRIMTDYIGNYNTVVMETQVKDLAEFEQMLSDYKTGKIEIDAQLKQELANYTELWQSGHREVFQLVD